ncbi:mediator of RNA polymerase II transcription subunit 26-like isoform X1 [Acipenser ruthenus]|uniref:mediator of RNA polymerase II transcription subunit 26-like isoform X1 n=2 Tax=Acipenser ruthenus TaxID=7906 RepID=UPI0027417781|nr:mediator of RNA polymerase II transcription subunit 26-like isoform X1 [Acipenser ruthenus]
MYHSDASPSPLQLKELLLQSIDRDANVLCMKTVAEVIAMLEKYPITKEELEETRLGRHINNLRKKTLNTDLSKRAKRLLKTWRKIALVGQESMVVAPGVTAEADTDTLEMAFPETCFPKSADVDNRNVPPSTKDLSFTQYNMRLKQEFTAVDSPEVITSPTAESASPGFLPYRPVTSSKAVPKVANHRHLARSNKVPPSPNSGHSNPWLGKPESWPRVFQEPGSLETISPASCSTPPHSPAAVASDYSANHKWPQSTLPFPVSLMERVEEVQHTSSSQPSTFDNQNTKLPILPEIGYNQPKDNIGSLVPTDCLDTERIPLKNKPKRGRKKGRLKDFRVNLDSPQSDTMERPGRLKERRITYNPLTGQIILASQKTIAATHDVGVLAVSCGQVSELRERNLQIWDSMDKQDWKEFAKNKIIQKYLSSQCHRWSFSSLEPQEYREHLRDCCPTSQPSLVLPTEPSTSISGVIREVSMEDVARLHTQNWQGVNGCYDDKGNWYDWARCISLDPYRDEGKLNILPYVCLD